MSRLGPIITLAAGAALVAGLGVASITAAPTGGTTAANVTAEATSTPTPIQTTAAPAETVKPTPVKADYGGYVKGNGGLIAISVRNGKAVGYFCDGKTEAWFKGKAADGKTSLQGFGDATVSATFGGGKAKGWLSVSGKKWSFSALTVKKPSGLYRATAEVRGAKIKSGWIVLPRPNGNGFTQVGVTLLNDEPIPTPELTPGQPVTIDGAQVEPEDVDGFIEEMS